MRGLVAQFKNTRLGVGRQEKRSGRGYLGHVRKAPAAARRRPAVAWFRHDLSRALPEHFYKDSHPVAATRVGHPVYSGGGAKWLQNPRSAPTTGAGPGAPSIHFLGPRNYFAVVIRKAWAYLPGAVDGKVISSALLVWRQLSFASEPINSTLLTCSFGWRDEPRDWIVARPSGGRAIWMA